MRLQNINHSYIRKKRIFVGIKQYKTRDEEKTLSFYEVIKSQINIEIIPLTLNSLSSERIMLIHYIKK